MYFVSAVFNFLNIVVFISIEFKFLDCSFCVFKFFLKTAVFNFCCIQNLKTKSDFIWFCIQIFFVLQYKYCNTETKKKKLEQI